jgi:threonine dehydrogenase-like Zn-dependent dehydrogenase
MSEYAAVPWEKLIIDNEVSPLRFALVEPMSVGFHAVARAGVTDSDAVMVIGCGMIGMGAIVRASLRGACVIALDVDDAKLEVARKFGASHTVNAAGNVERSLMDITSGSMPDVTIEAAGSPAAYRSALVFAGFSGRVACIGYAPSDVSLPTKLIVQKELDVRGSRNALPDDFRAVIACLKRNALPVESLISSVCKPEEAGDALKNWADRPGEVFRILTGFG